MKAKMGIIGGTALAAIIAVAGFGFGAVAGAQTTPGQTPPTQPASPQPVHITGQVIQVSANGLQLRTPRGEVNAAVDAETWIVAQRDRQCVEVRLNEIQTNRPVQVWGMTTGRPGQVDARMVAQGRCFGPDPTADAPKRGQPNQPNQPNKPVVPGKRPNVPAGKVEEHAALGTIKSVSGSNVVVTTLRGGEATLVTTADTVVVNNGFQSVGSLKAGDKIAVIGGPAKADKPAPGAEKPATRAINAWGIRVVGDSTKMVVGKIESVSGNSAKLTRPGDKDGLTVNFDGAQFKSVTLMDGKSTVASAVLADVKAGSVLTIEGVLSADGKTLQAKAVIIMPAVVRNGPANKPGTVTP